MFVMIHVCNDACSMFATVQNLVFLIREGVQKPKTFIIDSQDCLIFPTMIMGLSVGNLKDPCSANSLTQEFTGRLAR